MKKSLCRFAAVLTAGMIVFVQLFCPLRLAVDSAYADAALELSGVACALLMDTATGKVIYEKAADEQKEFAGLVRLPALLLICRAFDDGMIFDNTVVTVSAGASKIKGTTAFLAANERINADSLLKAAVMLNAGDAVCALLQALYPSEAAGTEAVNALLSSLGIKKELPSAMGAGAEFSANEIAAVSIELIKSPSFLKYSSLYTDVLRHEAAADTELTNPNRLVRHYSGCFGLATGSVGSSMYCGAFAARRGGTEFIAVVGGASGSDARFTAARELLDYGFSAYRTVELMGEGEAVAVLPVTGGTLREVSVVTGASASVLAPVNDAKVTSESELPEFVEAPVAEGDTLGELIVYNSGGAVISRVPLVAAHTVERAEFGDYFMLMLRRWLGVGGDM